MDPHSVDSIAAAIDLARAAYEELVGVAEEIDDEWSYVNDLSTAWLDRLTDVAAARGAEAAGPGVAEAVDALVAETTAIEDPHRAIDWLSTAPQVLLIALGERP